MAVRPRGDGGLTNEPSGIGIRRPRIGPQRVAALHGELLVLGVKVAASTYGRFCKEAGIDPASGRACITWADVVRSQADALLACDFLETVTLTGTRMYVFAAADSLTVDPSGSKMWARNSSVWVV